MYCTIIRALKIPTNATDVWKITTLRSTSKVFTSTDITMHDRNIINTQNVRNNHERPYRCNLYHLGYSILLGATAYASYKFW